MKEHADETGVLAPIVAFGAQITLDTCILASPMLPPEIKTLMTNSAKYAYYAPSLLNTRVTFGSLADCVRSAVEGRVVRDESAVADRVIAGRAIVAGEAEGEALVTHDALSFWGGYDFHTGEIIDRHHPLAGVRAAGRILAVPFSKGSSTTTAVLLEAVRAGTAPAAILTTGVDAFFALASIVAGRDVRQVVPRHRARAGRLRVAAIGGTARHRAIGDHQAEMTNQRTKVKGQVS